MITPLNVCFGAPPGYYFSCKSHTYQDSPYYCLKDDVRVNQTAIPASYYGCQEGGYCPNKQVTSWQISSRARYGGKSSTLADLMVQQTGREMRCCSNHLLAQSFV